MAAIVYGLNVSLIHFALFIMIVFVVHWPNSEKAAEFDLLYEEIDFIKHIGKEPTLIDDSFEGKTCYQISEDMNIWLKKFVVVHIMCCIINLQREIFDTKLGLIPIILKFLEVVLFGTYNFGIIQAL
jgi:hypothetical protein